MTSQDSIVIADRERVIERAHEELPLWVQSTPQARPVIPWLSLENPAALPWDRLLGKPSTLVAALPGKPCPSLFEGIRQLSSSARVYLHGPPGLSGQPEVQALLRGLGERALFREGSALPAGFLVADQGRQAVLFLGAPGQEPRWALGLSGQRALALHALFCQAFWHRAQRQVWLEGGLPVNEQPAPSPYPSGSGFTCPEVWLSRGEGLSVPGTPELVLAPAGLPLREVHTQQFVAPPEALSAARLEALSTAGTSVAWSALDLPGMALSRTRGVVFLGEQDEWLGLELEAAEAAPMLSALSSLKQRGEWVFRHRCRLGAVTSQVIAPGESKPQPVLSREEMDLGKVLPADIAVLDSAEPSHWPPARGLAGQLVYRWQVVPPTAPTGAGPSRLAKEWTATDEYVRRRVDELGSCLKDAERDELKRDLKGKIPGLTAALAEAAAERAALRETLDLIGESPLSARPSEAARLLDDLEAAEKSLLALEERCQRAEEVERQKLAADSEAAGTSPSKIDPRPAVRLSPSTRPAVPPEALPKLGKLLEHQGQRYLAIKTRREIALAITESRRLGATLVVAK